MDDLAEKSYWRFDARRKGGESCWCKPRIEYETNGYSGYSTIVIHNSMDGREKFETGERKAS